MEPTLTNLERRVQRVRKAIELIGDSKPDWWIICQIAKRMGLTGFDYQSAAEMFDEMATLAPPYYARFEEKGIQWPASKTNHPGTPQLHREKFNTPSCKGRFSLLQYRPSFESVVDA